MDTDGGCGRKARLIQDEVARVVGEAGEPGTSPNKPAAFVRAGSGGVAALTKFSITALERCHDGLGGCGADCV